MIKLTKRGFYILCAAIIAGAGLIEWSMGRKFLGVGGRFGIWSGNIQSAHNSQYMADPYSFSHVNHGLLFYGIFWMFVRWLPWRTRVLMALLIEAAWEISENTDAVIERYRHATISLHYYGDSILNSMCDIVCMLIGFLIAKRLPWKISVALFIAIEVIMGVLIRDGLILNIIMLIHPIDAIREWQSHR
jgi:hypothetical protein